MTQSQKTALVDEAITTITAPAKPVEKTTTVAEIPMAASAASTAPQYIASGIELNIPVEKIEAEKKSTVTVSHPPSTAVTVEARVEPSSTQSNAKKDKKEKLSLIHI